MSSDATDNTMRAELLSCPFCGNRKPGTDYVEAYSVDSSYYILGCGECKVGFRIDGREPGPADIAAWNRRADTARQVAEAVAAEREACAVLCENLRDTSDVLGEIESADAFDTAAGSIRARSTP